jgi:hypothetical protein
MIMYKNAPIIMASVIAAILTASAFTLPNHVFARPVLFSSQPAGSGPQIVVPLATLRAGNGAASVAANAPGLALSAAGGAAPSVAANAPGLALSAAPGAQGLPRVGISAGSASLGLGCYVCLPYGCCQ